MRKPSVAYLLLPFKSAKTGPKAGFFMPMATIFVLSRLITFTAL
jgi:hypothetical protein